MYELIIIGAGPAGLTSALYAGRYRFKTLVLEKMAVGGQIVLSPTIDNFPAFPGGIATQELIERIKNQVDELGVEFSFDEVLAIEEESSGYKVRTAEKSYNAQTLIIASGAQAKRLGVKGEEELTGRGISYCGTCDGPLFRDKEIVLVGGGDRAIEEAIFLSGYASKVSVIHRRKELRASKILQEKAAANRKIHFILGAVVEEISGKGRVEAVKARSPADNSLLKISCSGVFIFVGIKPNTDFLKNFLELDEAGFIITAQDLATSKKGIFACGDCISKGLYQVVNACGEGAQAAASVHKYLLNKK